MYRLALALLASGLLGLAASPALAQEQPPADADARTLFRQGQTAYDQGDYRAAIEKWNEAHELDPKPLIQYNLSQAYERLGELPKAVAALERYLDAADPDDPNQANARARLSSLRDRLGRTGITIDGAPEGASIAVDGEAWGRTPRPDPIPVSPGSHEVELTREGYEDFRSTVVTSAGQVAEIEVAMQRAKEGGAGATPVRERHSPFVWMLLGGGGAVLVAGAVVGGLALAASGGDDPEPGKARTLGQTADGLLWPGAAIAAAGLVWLFVEGVGEQSADTADVRVTPYVGRAGGGVGAGGTF